ADSLGYISIEGMIEATTLPESRLCTACFSGDYPIPLGENDSPATSTPPMMGAPADGLSTLSVGRGGEGALKHPCPSAPRPARAQTRSPTKPPASTRKPATAPWSSCAKP